MKKLDEILDDLIRAQAGDMDNSFPVEQLSKQEAKSLIAQELKGGMPPKFNREGLMIKERYAEGYNQALSDVLKAIDEMCGRGK